jgi:YD repeat-containing protein
MLESRMLEVAEDIYFYSFGRTVTTRYNENDQPIESLIRNANGELLTKINHNYANGRLISETLVIVRLSETIWRRTMQEQERFPENEQGRENMAKTRAFLDQLQGGMECSYTYDADDRVIRTLMQMGDFKWDESKTYNTQGDEDWTLMIRNEIDDEREEFRYLYQYDSHGNWTERTKINTDQPGNPNTQRRTLAYY